MDIKGNKTPITAMDGPSETGFWGAAMTPLQDWDPSWAETYFKMVSDPWNSEVLPRKLVELIGVALNAGSISLNPDGMRRHMRAALQAGATREQILLVLKMASVMSFDSCMLAAPIVLEEASEGELDAAGLMRAKRHKNQEQATPAVEQVKALGRWNVDWDPVYDLAPVWTEQFMATAMGIHAGDVLPVKEIELLAIAFEAPYTDIYTPSTRRHIKNALRAGASVEEIVEVLKLCVIQSVEACNLGVPILEEELSAPGNYR
ncbi:MAG: carboxymuconolactone decarboxylase family protein [Candidatus Korobacteraceae bacterium]|jgi:alkylhydroperoxidase/carboxymuconolactone decarboxylase family protein YurZ